MSISLGARINREAAHLKNAALLSPGPHAELSRQDHDLHRHVNLSWRLTPRGALAEPNELVIFSSPFLHDLPGFEQTLGNLPAETRPPNLHHALAFGKNARTLTLADGAVVYAVRKPFTSALSSTSFFDAHTRKVATVEYNPSDDREPIHATFHDHPLAARLVEQFYGGTLA